jgi:cobalt-zinc-cadmium efflux system protein
MSGGHAHHHHPHDFSTAFAVGIVLNIGFVIVEAGFGIASNSMALLSDAGHNLSDVLGLVIAWAGAAMARRPSSARFTYGLKKAPILAALFNSLFLLVAVGAILAEAVRRLIHPAATEAHTIMAVAAAGILVNGITAWLFARGRKADINIRGAFLHMASDALVSLAVVLSGAAILWTGAEWIDPAMSIAVAAVILWGSFGLLKESTGMSLAGVPSGIALDEVEAALGRLPGVETVHDLHVWPLSTTETALTAHLVAPSVVSTDALLMQAQSMLHDRFHIEHCTLQVEGSHLEDTDCC